MDDKIQCLECGNWFIRITDKHLNVCCNLSVKRYKEKYPNVKLVSNILYEKMKTGKYIKCQQCNKKVYRNKWAIDKSKNHFCSPKCSQLYHSGENHKDYGITGKSHFNYNRITLKCLNCDKEFDRIPYNVNRGQYKFCSKKCSFSYVNFRSPNYNKDACKFFDKLNEYLGWKGLHAENEGEHSVLGYFLDYYEPELNLVIEWDEQHHYDKIGNLKEKDKNRQQEIEGYLSCNFYRIKENRNSAIVNFLAEFGTKSI